jgi:hypothetical protein
METRWSLCLYLSCHQLCIEIHLNNTDGESNQVFAGFNITLGKRKVELGDKSSFTHEGLDLELLNSHAYKFTL